MDTIQVEEKNSLHFSETENATPVWAEHSLDRDESVGGMGERNRETEVNTNILSVDNSASLDTVRLQLDDLKKNPGEQMPSDEGSIESAETVVDTREKYPLTQHAENKEDRLPESTSNLVTHTNSTKKDEERSGVISTLLTNTQETAANFIYEFLGSKSPRFIKAHVPVYRAVDKQYAGLGNYSGTSEWTIGVKAKEHAYDWVDAHKPHPNDPITHYLENAEEYVAIKSTLGELESHGKTEVRHYGDYGSERKKVIVKHTDPNVLIKHKIIRSNKDR